LYAFLFSPMCATCPTHLSILELAILFSSKEQFSKFLKGLSPEQQKQLWTTHKRGLAATRKLYEIYMTTAEKTK
jgi:hypothetical protein